MAQAGPGRTSVPRIMMIDDELSNLQIVKIILMRENLPCDLLTYDNGSDALQYLRAHSVDLILLDLAMPGMDGFEVMRHLQENPAVAQVPVIFLSAYQDTEYILRAFELGTTDFIGKPIISPILTARIRHILETRRLQIELQQSNDELVNTNRLKDELLSICSHDLRAPLNAIELICQFLADAAAGRSEQSQPELINRIVSQSRLARRLVENLLDLNRIEEGRLIPAPSFFPLDELVRTCMEADLPTLQVRKLQHALELPAPGLLCFGDREMIAQVVHNVLNNAARFARSRIEVQGTLGPYSAEHGGTFTLGIADDGEGIPAALQRTVFDKYAKLEAQGSGSGLGLYISRQMLELHHGDISVESREGQGTRFVVSLPNVFQAADLPDLSPLHPRRVIVASASRATAQLLESVLVEAGLVDVSQAVSADQLEALLDAAPPDLVVMDLQAELLMAQLAERLADAASSPRWIVFGEPGAAAAFGQSWGAAPTEWAALHPPLNPLVYLHLTGRLLDQEGNLEASASV